jgi:hypothetical protein
MFMRFRSDPWRWQAVLSAAREAVNESGSNARQVLLAIGSMGMERPARLEFRQTPSTVQPMQRPHAAQAVATSTPSCRTMHGTDDQTPMTATPHSLPSDVGLSGRLVRTERVVARLERARREQEQDLRTLEEENEEMHRLAERQRSQLRAIPKLQADLDAMREELRLSEAARTEQAYCIDELRRELRTSVAESERLRTLMAGAAWCAGRC